MPAMPMELGLWRVDGQPMRLTPVGVPLEKTLEDLIEHDPDILGEPLIIIGRQVPCGCRKPHPCWSPVFDCHIRILSASTSQRASDRRRSLSDDDLPCCFDWPTSA